VPPQAAIWAEKPVTSLFPLLSSDWHTRTELTTNIVYAIAEPWSGLNSSDRIEQKSDFCKGLVIEIRRQSL